MRRPPRNRTYSCSGSATTPLIAFALLACGGGGDVTPPRLTPPQACTGGLQLSLGELHPLTAAERVSLCVGAPSGAAAEYVLIPFGNSTVAATMVPVTIKGTKTEAPVAPLTAPLASSPAVDNSGSQFQPLAQGGLSIEDAFRRRERLEVPFTSLRGRRARAAAPQSRLSGIPATPIVGSIVQLNTNLDQNLCTAAKTPRGARVVAVLPRTLVFVDTLSPAGGYSDAELAAFGQAFDTLGYGVDTLNFGAPSDVDGNGRVAIFFTPSVNAIPGPPGGFVGGLQTARDLFPVANCVASNEGEIFYLPTPDPDKTINGNYPSKANLARGVLSTLVHEFQHLINAGRRIYVNNASAYEEVWLNEGLSHIAEELLYYRVSGNRPKMNIDLPLARSSQAQLDAINAYQIQNLGRLSLYMAAPETHSPYAQNDDLETRGATWQLLRYAADRKGGEERNTWFALVNSTTVGQANFNAVFGNIIGMTRDWAVAQIADDAGLPVAAIYMHPSWNFRSLLPALNSGKFPLLTRPLASGTPVEITLRGGGAGYVRFRVPAGVAASVESLSSGQPVPASVDLMLLRTQ